MRILPLRGVICAAAWMVNLPPATAQTITVQLPTFGVAVDPAGVLSVKSFADPTGRLQTARLQAAKQELAADLLATSPLRKISLVRLEAAIRRRREQGEQPDGAMRYLAGLQRLSYVFCYPETKDIVIAGPAEGFWADLAGRVRGVTTGRPVVELHDLVVALRAFPPGAAPARPFLGCTIEPTPEAMQRLVEFQRTIPHAVPESQRQAVGARIAEGMRTSLGLAPIRVFGLPPDTHFAQVLVEADYRMKLAALGLEPLPIRLPSYFDLLGSGNVRQGALQRWWFVPDYDCVKVTDDRRGMELVGQGVQLLTEAKLVGPDGRLSSGGPSNKASETFAQGFTRKYPELAAKSPAYAQLRNLIDLLVAAAFIQQQDFAGQAGWSMATFRDERALPVCTQAVPVQVACAVNAAWKGNRFIAVAGGGVSIRPDEALQSQRLQPDQSGAVARLRAKVTEPPPADRWWWD
jgi:hypothetical protein